MYHSLHWFEIRLYILEGLKFTGCWYPVPGVRNKVRGSRLGLESQPWFISQLDLIEMMQIYIDSLWTYDRNWFSDEQRLKWNDMEVDFWRWVGSFEVCAKIISWKTRHQQFNILPIQSPNCKNKWLFWLLQVPRCSVKDVLTRDGCAVLQLESVGRQRYAISGRLSLSWGSKVYLLPLLPVSAADCRWTNTLSARLGSQQLMGDASSLEDLI